jgi:hypothetical protein
MNNLNKKLHHVQSEHNPQAMEELKATAEAIRAKTYKSGNAEMESEKDAVIRRAARDYGKRHPGLINPSAEIMQEDKVKKNKKGVPVFNAQKVLDNQCTRKHLLDDNENVSQKHKVVSHKSTHSTRTRTLLRNEILFMWLLFLGKHSKSSKGLAELRANFMDELFAELGI